MKRNQSFGFLLLTLAFFLAGFQPNQSFAQCIDVIGVGMQGSTTKSITIPGNLTDIDYLVVETIFKGGTAGNVEFSSSAETILQTSSDRIKPMNAITSTSKGSYRATMQPVSSVTVKRKTGTAALQSLVVYIYKKSGTCNGTYSTRNDRMCYFYRNSETWSYSIPTCGSKRDISVTIPLAELNNDSRIAKLTFSAGGISKTVTTNTYNKGKSLYLTTITLQDVPANTTSATLKVESPSTNGDSYLNGSTVFTYDCAQVCNSDKNELDPCVLVVGQGVDDVSDVTLDMPIPASQIDFIEVEATYKGSTPSLTFSSSTQSFSRSSSDAIGFKNLRRAASHTGIYRAKFNAADWIKMKTTSGAGYLVTFVAYIHKKSAYCAENNTSVDKSEVYDLYRQTYNINKTLPSTVTNKNVTITVPIGELNNDGRWAKITLEAGGRSVYLDATNYDNGNSLTIKTLTLPDVPGNVTSAKITLLSSSTYGDSWTNGPIVFNWYNPCEKECTGNADKVVKNCGAYYSSNILGAKDGNGAKLCPYDYIIVDLTDTIKKYSGIAVTIKAPYGSADYKVYNSKDGYNWTVIKNSTISSTGYTDVIVYASDDIRYMAVKNTDNCKCIKVDAITYSCTDIVPVEWLSFTGDWLDQSNTLLNWKCAQEINNSKFVLERRVDNEDGFTAVTEIAGAGNSTEITSYQFVDDVTNISGRDIYYRVKQVDYDGNYDYSEMIVLSRNNSSNIVNYPNPATDVVNISLSEGMRTKDLRIEILNTLGQYVTDDVTIETSDHQWTVLSDHLPEGAYFIQIIGSASVETKSFMIKR